MVGKIWDWLNGKKTVVGAVITIVAFAPEIIAQLPNFGVSPEDTARVLGIAVTVVGLLHKAYKFIYREEHP